MTILIDVNAKDYDPLKSGYEIIIDNKYSISYFYIKLSPTFPLPQLLRYILKIGVAATRGNVDMIRKIANETCNKIKLIDNQNKSLILRANLNSPIFASVEGDIPLRGIIYGTKKRFTKILDFFTNEEKQNDNRS